MNLAQRFSGSENGTTHRESSRNVNFNLFKLGFIFIPKSPPSDSHVDTFFSYVLYTHALNSSEIGYPYFY